MRYIAKLYECTFQLPYYGHSQHNIILLYVNLAGCGMLVVESNETCMPFLASMQSLPLTNCLRMQSWLSARVEGSSVCGWLNGHCAVAKLHFLASIMYKCQTEVNMIMFPLKPKWMTTCRLMKLEDMIELPYSGKLSGEKTFTNFTIF